MANNYVTAIEVVEKFSGWTPCEYTHARSAEALEWCAKEAGLWTLIGPNSVAFQKSEDALAFTLKFVD